MAKKKRNDVFDGEISVRIFDKAKAALEHVHTDLKRDARLQFQERAITQDALLLASWLWFEELGPQIVAEGLHRHVATLNKIAASQKAAAALSSVETGPVPPKKGLARLKVGNVRDTTARDKAKDAEYRKGSRKKRSGEQADSENEGSDRGEPVPPGR